MSGSRPQTPAEAWRELLAGNGRFVSGDVQHPNQDAARRADIAGGQRPFATFFGCSDSRVAAEVIFDQGLGDLFVIRTAGHVVGPTELGSMEFGAEVLDIPLIVVLGHDSCGAVGATMEAVESGTMPKGLIRDLVQRIMPSVVAGKHQGMTSVDELMAEHVRQTVNLIVERSTRCAERVEDGRLAIVGLTYTLADGRASIAEVVGDIGESPAPTH
ncbi:carbonic anhydrase [Mobilicoccus caccae]|uniref:carbonic anhydrase n=1 Tax=Mobilicoccus caccae TaxID=1859295 RepID=A0ABQ6IUV2_9MICO|nr:carbonic anhydrase [Mobilicoccus caccae]GMA40522.1 carbonic anhydrase 2 [Mobilicoccus caccae]